MRLQVLCGFILCAQKSLAFVPIGHLSNRISSSNRCNKMVSMHAGEPSTRRELLDRIVTVAGLTAAVTAFGGVQSAEAIGPVKITLTNWTYEETICPPKTQIPGQKAGFGLKPVCVKVTADADNPSPKDVIDAAVFGRVYDEDGTSVVANNPDGASDAGQFAIIDGAVAPGKSKISFNFVAAIGPQEELSKKKLKFQGVKGISYPGGGRYGAITECEMNPLADECELGDDIESYKRRSK